MRRLLEYNNPGQVPAGICALAIMTKAPRPGAVKTRLQPPLTPKEAALLNTCFLQDTGAAIMAACGSEKQEAIGIAVYTPAGSEQVYKGILPDEFRLLLQRGDGFGARLANAAADLLDAGFSSCCLIDSDSPTVTAEAFRDAVRVLQAKDNRVVLGPTDDGGYYLIGMKALHRPLFQQIDWSTERVLEQTMRRARQLKLDVHMLPTHFDVDDAPSLRRLYHELLIQNRSGAPATKMFLQQLVERTGERLFAK